MSRVLVGSFTDFTLRAINHIASPPAYKLLLTSSVSFPLCPADSDRQTRMHSCHQPTNYQTTMNHLLPSQPLASLMLAATALRSAQGRWTYLLANPTSEPRVISISNPHLHGKNKFLLHSYLSDDFLQSVSQPSGTTTLKSRHGQVTILLPPRSLLSVSEPPSSPARH